VQVKVDNQSKAVHKAVKYLAIPVKAVLIAIYRGKDVIITHGDTIIYGGDIILAFADDNAQATINELFSSQG